MEADVQAFLEHVGVKGMKWGVRRDPKTGAKAISAKRRKQNVDKVHRAMRITSGALFIGYLISGHVGPSSRPAPPRAAIKVAKATKSTMSPADALRMHEAQRNGAFQIKQFLKETGGDVL